MDCWTLHVCLYVHLSMRDESIIMSHGGAENTGQKCRTKRQKKQDQKRRTDKKDRQMRNQNWRCVSETIGDTDIVTIKY